MQRKIKRAEREGLTYEEGQSDSLLAKFYQLLLFTRRRHGLPPQPVAWFRNLITCLGDKVKIRVASKDGCPVASMLTLRHKQVLVYKYGCSDTGSTTWVALNSCFGRRFRELRTISFSSLIWDVPIAAPLV